MCASRPSARWSPSTTPTGSPPPAVTPTAKCASSVANGLGTLRTGADAVRGLIDDPDPLVRAAALAAMGSIGWDDVDVTSVESALAASAWQIRQGAARALAGAPSPTAAVPPLSRALSDPHLDVRKAAVLSLTRWASSEDAAREALTGALDDGDADVRAYARQSAREKLSYEPPHTRFHLNPLRHCGFSCNRAGADLSVVECMFESCWRLRFR